MGFLAAIRPACAAVCFVDGNAGAPGDGSSWGSAYKDLQGALGNVACTEIWAAKFVYKPSTSNTGVGFGVAPGKALYGGFAGTETQRTQRSPSTNLTVLSGDIDGNDCGGGGCANGVAIDAMQINGSNTRHIVIMDGTGATPIAASTVLDGFTISGADAVTDSGGGLYCNGGGAGKTCSPTLANLVFSGNRASNLGGAMLCLAEPDGVSSPALSNVAFVGNKAAFGGGMYDDGASGGTSSPTLDDVTFSGNSATQWGGAMFNDGNAGTSSPALSSVTFAGNSAKSGGAMYDEGTGGNSNPTLTNVTFSGNSADQAGGAMQNDAVDGGSASPVLINVTFNGNSTSTYGGAISSAGISGGISVPLLTNVILWGDSATLGDAETVGGASIAYGIVQGGCPVGASCTHLVSGNPQLGPLRDNGGATQTLHLGVGSTAIDAGDDANCPDTDQRGMQRPQGAHCDLGAVEVDRIFGDGFNPVTP